MTNSTQKNDRVINFENFPAYHTDIVNGAPAWNHWDGRVVKIVLGTLEDGGKKRSTLDSLPPDFAKRFGALTHLYLWNLDGLKELPALPDTLQCLDLRGCKELKSLPQLPASLETLDVAGCSSLGNLPLPRGSGLKRFYCSDCGVLKSHVLETFLASDGCANLEDLDISNTPALRTLDVLPYERLRKLVLKNCKNLTNIEQLAKCTEIQHLNLEGCTGIKILPDIAALKKLQFLVLHGGENLQTFLGQSIGPYDRGKSNENVAKKFKSRAKFGDKLAVMPHAKLLLMGDGRVGKTTLAKRLQWECLDSVARAKPESERLRPDKDEKFTHKVQFWPWNTGLALAPEEMKKLEEGAAAANLEVPKTPTGLLDGAIRIWDFGGQEIYHSTHRIFAGEGSIFLIVWRDTPPDSGTAPEDVSPEEWKEQNRQRSIDYWLDYIYSMRPGAEVALVCTKCENPDKLDPKPDWRVRAKKYADRGLECFYVDTLDDNCGKHKQYKRLVDWIRNACAREALRIGILQPFFYRQVYGLVDEWTQNNSKTLVEAGRNENMLCSWTNWEKNLRELHKAAASGREPHVDRDDILVITEYLHAAGHLFYVRTGSEPAILVDQQWAAELIYRMLLCGSELRKKIKSRGGRFYGVELEMDEHWKSLQSEMQRNRLLNYMEECRILTRIADSRTNRAGQDLYLASEKWLLPEYREIEGDVEKFAKLVREKPGYSIQEKFEFENIELSEFEYRNLQAFVASTFKTDAIYFRNGLQAMGSANEWCFRMRWLPNDKDAAAEDSFSGKIDATLWAELSAINEFKLDIEDLLFGSGSPIEGRRSSLRRERADARHLTHEYFRPLRQNEYDIAVSSSGKDVREAELLVGALRAAGVSVNWYRLPECRVEEREKVLYFMTTLGKPKCILIMVSENYVKADPVNNWYCAYELADAVRSVGNRLRANGKTLVVYKKSSNFHSRSLNEQVVRLFESMCNFFADAYAKVAPREKKNFMYYNEFNLHFIDALEGGNCGRFFEEFGTLGTYLSLPDNVSEVGAFDKIVTAVKKAVKDNK